MASTQSINNDTPNLPEPSLVAKSLTGSKYTQDNKMESLKSQHLQSLGPLVSIKSLNSSMSTVVNSEGACQAQRSSSGSASQLAEGNPSPALPPKRGTQLYRWLRWGFGSVYRRIFTLVYLVNLAVLAVLIGHEALGQKDGLTYDNASIAVSANLLASLFVRNEHIVNAMFIVFCTWSKHAPLPVRRLCAKIYSYGGVHSGGGISATFWYTAYLVMVTREFAVPNIPLIRGYILLVSYMVVILLIAILVFAYPRIRILMHNWFEGIHRFLGWSVILLFWAQTLMLAADAARVRQVSMGRSILISPSFWMLVIITALVIYPWAHLRLRNVEVEVLSDHVAKLTFDYAKVNYGQAVRLSDAPLKETHAFAVIPDCRVPQRSSHSESASSNTLDLEASGNIANRGFSVLVSNAGDWTKKMIQNPPKRIWTRGCPQYGVLRVAGLFKPVIIVATGSGIGPCLSLFVQAPEHPVRIIWSTPSPEQSYGQAIIDILLRADPQAIIIDTRKSGRPDLVAIAYQVYESSRRQTSGESKEDEGRWNKSGNRREPLGACEACVVISNQRVTKKVVYGLESRGLPAYGAIFDS
ncbi:hypothetical protein F5B20DRAFT_5953 [Whalleya microplaca]|nr:hypothetical protein F5B20DRAFT_5953 [Whalleya microplaca]